MKQILKQVRQTLKESADEKTLAGSRRFFKESDCRNLKFLGVKVPLVNRAAREHFAAMACAL